jgi:large subunit ribosomal protein L20
MSGLSYSALIRGLSKAQVELDRKVLAELAYTDPASFAVVAEKAKAAL